MNLVTHMISHVTHADASYRCGCIILHLSVSLVAKLSHEHMEHVHITDTQTDSKNEGNLWCQKSLKTRTLSHTHTCTRAMRKAEKRWTKTGKISSFPAHTTHCNTPQRTATYCDTLQHTATHCNVLQHINSRNTRNSGQERAKTDDDKQQRLAAEQTLFESLAHLQSHHSIVHGYSVLQCVAMCCNVLQCGIQAEDMVAFVAGVAQNHKIFKLQRVAVCCSVLQCVAVWHTGRRYGSLCRKSRTKS